MTEAAWAAAFNEKGTAETELQGAIVTKLIDGCQGDGRGDAAHTVTGQEALRRQGVALPLRLRLQTPPP